MKNIDLHGKNPYIVTDMVATEKGIIYFSAHQQHNIYSTSINRKIDD